MNLPALAIEKKPITYFAAVLILLGGIACYFQLGQLEDPEFTVKTAAIITQYPGASAEEVELEVTDPIETKLQEMVEIKRIYSNSRAGVSIIKVDIKSEYWADRLPQVWDILRKKIKDMQHTLPPGAGEPSIGDDFGFVYGFMLAMTGDGYSYAELEQYAKELRKELNTVPGAQPPRLAQTPQQTRTPARPRLSARAGRRDLQGRLVPHPGRLFRDGLAERRVGPRRQRREPGEGRAHPPVPDPAEGDLSGRLGRPRPEESQHRSDQTRQLRRLPRARLPRRQRDVVRGGGVCQPALAEGGPEALLRARGLHRTARRGHGLHPQSAPPRPPTTSARGTACPARPSGNTPRGQGPRRPSTRVRSPSWRRPRTASSIPTS